MSNNFSLTSKQLRKIKPFITKAFVCRARFKRDGTSAKTRFRLSEKRASPFESAGVST
jgi:hypothetical protein